jgi:hypothetical protein
LIHDGIVGEGAKTKERGEVKVEKIIAEMLKMDAGLEKRQDAFKRSIIKLRLKMVDEIYRSTPGIEDQTLIERDTTWMYDV